MTTRFFASDHHFDHANSLTFKRADGTPLRDFASVEEMNETMIERHNSVVKANDICYFLGDVSIPRRGLQHVKRLNGRKKLIMGNHDVFVKKNNQDYVDAGFEQIQAVHLFDKFVATHIPLHEQQISSRFNHNVHGHLHSNRVMKWEMRTPFEPYCNGYWVPDERYTCVCVEQIDYTPISLEELNERIA